MTYPTRFLGFALLLLVVPAVSACTPTSANGNLTASAHVTAASPQLNSAVQSVLEDKRSVGVQPAGAAVPGAVALSALRASAFSPYRALPKDDSDWFHGNPPASFEECPHCRALGNIISSEYGNRRDPRRRGIRLHHGIDIRAPKGSAALAFMGGEVITAKRQNGYGLCIEIRQDDGMVARYAHLSKMAVQPGQRVETGAQIGDTGNTGRTTGPHLHFELIKDGKSLDPMLFLTRSEQVMRCLKLEAASK